MSSFDRARCAALELEFKNELVGNILPFWLDHGMDRESGGIITSLDRRGGVLDSDKSVWFQGRAAWTFSTAFLEIERRSEYLDAARSCVDFLERHCFDRDGRMFFRVTREGLPLVKRRRYVFSETFAAVAMAAYSRAARLPEYALKARAVFDGLLATLRSPGLLEPKFDEANRPSRGFALPMILIVVAQELRKANPADASFYDQFIDQRIREIETCFIDEEHRCVLEQCGPKGERQFEHFEGRLLNPGHAIEGAWFILAEAQARDSARYRKLGLTMLDWMWDWGWDREHGGIIYFRDALGKAGNEYWHDMKFWWPQNEAVIANLMAYADTGEPRYAERFEQAYGWAKERFPDREFGEWYGYLHRDGSISTELKGNMYKGPFHIPRMYIVCAGLAKRILDRYGPSPS